MAWLSEAVRRAKMRRRADRLAELRHHAPPPLTGRAASRAVRLALLALLLASRQEISARVLAREAGVDHKTAGRMLDELVLCDWLTCRRRRSAWIRSDRGGVSWWYRANPRLPRPPLPTPVGGADLWTPNDEVLAAALAEEEPDPQLAEDQAGRLTALLARAWRRMQS